jgi:hypothetical protein
VGNMARLGFSNVERLKTGVGRKETRAMEIQLCLGGK